MVAEVPAPALPANALERIDQVDARAAVQAGIAAAVVDVLVAVRAGVARVADTSAAVAAAPAAARRALAAAAELLVRHAELEIVRGRLRTVLALPLFRAVAVVVGLRVEARRRVAARVRAAVVPVDLALVAGEADRAHALVRVHEITALAAVLARLGRALVDVDVAILARVAGGAAAVIVVHQVNAERAVLALVDAVVDVLRAVLPGEAASTSAPVNDSMMKKKPRVCQAADRIVIQNESELYNFDINETLDSPPFVRNIESLFERDFSGNIILYYFDVPIIRYYPPVVASQIDAREGILAGRLLERALVHVELAEHTLPSGRAVAREAVLAVHARTAVLARLRGALVDVGRAVRPGEARGTLAVRGLA